MGVKNKNFIKSVSCNFKATLLKYPEDERSGEYYGTGKFARTAFFAAEKLGEYTHARFFCCFGSYVSSVKNVTAEGKMDSV